MTLAPGTRLGPYEITAKLGEGGMGEVWRATDSQLRREVAIKVLPAAFTADAERLARFEREAQVLASLNHPNIAQIYGLETSGQTRALVMELVEGDDLSERLAHGALPLDECLAIARQLADALEQAHEKGIVHRDLKPHNVKLAADGRVKVLDFGLAKALDPAAVASGSPSASPTLMNSPTLTAAGTQLGVILGTAAYMAPEQARGRVVDRRADVWAFGALVYEMLTGRRAFPGDDVSDVLATVLKTEPDWSALPADTPPSVRRLLRRCLEKDPRRRLSAIGDARLELDDTEPAATGPASVPAPRPSLAARLWPALAGALLAAAVAALLWPSSRPAAGGVVRLSALAPPGTVLYPDSTGVAISPDGTQVAFIIGSIQSGTQLWVRSLDSTAARLLDDADRPILPFWSPDSRRIGFFASGKLKTIAASGGRAEVLCATSSGRGATWSPSNVIVFAPDASGPLYRIPASGGTPVPVTQLDAARKEYAHRFPTFLPDGEHFLFAALPGRAGKFDIFAGSLADDSRTLVGSLESAPVYAEPGWLLFARQGVLTAQRFDAKGLKLIGDPVSLDDEPTMVLDPAWSFTSGRTTSVSASGSLAYFSAPSTNTVAVWLDATGKTTGTLNLPPGHYETATISPDGTHAVLVRSTSPSESTLWLVDLQRGSASPLSSGHGRNDTPVWSPDSTRVVFASDRDGPEDFFVTTVTDAAPERLLYHSDALFKGPHGWSADGQWIAITQLDPDTAQDIWLLPASGHGELTPYLRGPLRDNAGPPSPDGRWLAYTSEDTGRVELYVQSFPVPGHKVQISEQGAALAWWTPDGRQMVFVDDQLQGLWRVNLEPGPAPGATLRVGTPMPIATLPPNLLSLDAMPDRQRFLAILPERPGPGSITIVQNWRAALDRQR